MRQSGVLQKKKGSAAFFVKLLKFGANFVIIEI